MRTEGHELDRKAGAAGDDWTPDVAGRSKETSRLLPPPTLRKGRHRGLARLGIAVGRCAILVMPKGERAKPRRINWRGCGLHDPADDDAIGEHIEIILFHWPDVREAEARLRMR
jgi:hypothetical protein